jgi:hypothetical protein
MVAAGAAILAAASTLLAPHAEAQSTRPLFLGVAGNCFAGDPHWVIVPTPLEHNYCWVLPRVMVQGQGYNALNEHFKSKRLSPVKVDSRRPIRGVVSVTTGGIAAQGQGVVEAEFRIRVHNVLVGTVTTGGASAEARTFAKEFSLQVPKSLSGKRVSSVDVEVIWKTCIGVVGCRVVHDGPSASRLTLPTR